MKKVIYFILMMFALSSCEYQVKINKNQVTTLPTQQVFVMIGDTVMKSSKLKTQSWLRQDVKVLLPVEGKYYVFGDRKHYIFYVKYEGGDIMKNFQIVSERLSDSTELIFADWKINLQVTKRLEADLLSENIPDSIVVQKAKELFSEYGGHIEEWIVEEKKR